MASHTALRDAIVAAREAHDTLLRAETLAFWPERRDDARVLVNSAAMHLADARRLLRELDEPENVVALPLRNRPRAVLNGDNFRASGIEDHDALTVLNSVGSADRDGAA